VVRTFGYDHMKKLNRYWYEDIDTVTMDEIEESSSDTPAANISTVLRSLMDS